MQFVTLDNEPLRKQMYKVVCAEGDHHITRTLTLIFALLLLVVPTVGAFAEERKSFEPEMVRIPSGTFDMGCVSGEDCDPSEKPVHRVTLKAFEIGKYEVTFGEYMVCVKAGGCAEPYWRRKGNEFNIKTGTNVFYKEIGAALTGDRQPVIGVSWNNTKQYAKWLSLETGKQYRLPTEAEWEYTARAKTNSKYWWGNKASHEYANYRTGKGAGGLVKGADKWIWSAPVGSFPGNGFGVHDMHGNVSEVVEDCWHGNYKRAPKDGSAWLKADNGDCGYHVLRGGSWYDSPRNLRSAYRIIDLDFFQETEDFGFRLARTL